MIEDRRRPGTRGAMASIALGGSTDMSYRLGLCILGKKNTTVASRALARRHARSMVHRSRRPVDKTADVAGIALRSSRDVHIGFRLRIGEIVRTTMTICTQAHRIDVVHLRRFERREIVMATVALFGRWNVVRGFPKRIDAIVAIRTTTGYRRIDCCMIRLGGCCP